MTPALLARRADWRPRQAGKAPALARSSWVGDDAAELLLRKEELLGAGMTWMQKSLRWAAAPVWRLAYGLYERQLEKQVRALPVPRHVGIILDGNRRHARVAGVEDPESIYRLGAAKLDDILTWSAGLGVRMVTLWVFSPDNLRRSEAEIGGIFGAVEAKMRALAADPHIRHKGVHIAAIGRRDLLPPTLLDAIDAAEAATRGNDQLTVTLAIGYGGREEIADAVRALLEDYAAQGLSTAQAAALVTPETIRQHLYLGDVPDPDLIIRTSGETRLSGFMLWQSVHSELYFCDVNWPVMRHIDYLRAIRSYQRRERRFGA
ncbi:polyprenyl diphosphate synthase [Acidocella sp. KAb 2-4]|uniref:polyprenyl diphosphate synthase n=1 Tax=Acidocella sp. KAb 2-4 TaxID=2885158 RepID=UPI001D068947|nr:polyprenyl diphosphate synthase [Acidocella sp. KAb 2-4]MCB5944364.1 di-trans,poly-cis-decaprenylcistransferase [Acidocella sp. KAb 2-4]